ncbi:MAG: hypothetical protein ACI8XB_000891 [Patiriisocius sp.]|jgi:hypothetical protein
MGFFLCLKFRSKEENDRPDIYLIAVENLIDQINFQIDLNPAYRIFLFRVQFDESLNDQLNVYQVLISHILLSILPN